MAVSEVKVGFVVNTKNQSMQTQIAEQFKEKFNLFNLFNLIYLFPKQKSVTIDYWLLSQKHKLQLNIMLRWL